MVRHVPHARLLPWIVIGSATFVAIACSAPVPESGKAPTDGPGPGVGRDAGSSSPPPAEPHKAGLCDGKASCWEVCQRDFPKGNEAEMKALSTCLCSASVCQAECGDNECAGKNPSAACDDCRFGTKANACFDQATAACNADTSCKDWRACIDKCPVPNI